MPAQSQVVVSGGFDDIKSRDLRFLEEAAKLGELTVLLWPDATLEKAHRQAAEISAGGTEVFSERRPLRQPCGRSRRRRPILTALPKNLRADIWADIEADGKCRARKICR